MTDRNHTTEEDRKAIEAKATGITAVRQAAATYLVAHGISQDVAWTVAMGNGPTVADTNIEITNCMDEVFAALDNARYAVEAQYVGPTMADALEGLMAGGVIVNVEDEEV